MLKLLKKFRVANGTPAPRLWPTKAPRQSPDGVLVTRNPPVTSEQFVWQPHNAYLMSPISDSHYCPWIPPS